MIRQVFGGKLRFTRRCASLLLYFLGLPCYDKRQLSWLTGHPRVGDRFYVHSIIVRAYAVPDVPRKTAVFACSVEWEQQTLRLGCDERFECLAYVPLLPQRRHNMSVIVAPLSGVPINRACDATLPWLTSDVLRWPSSQDVLMARCPSCPMHHDFGRLHANRDRLRRRSNANYRKGYLEVRWRFNTTSIQWYQP